MVLTFGLITSFPSPAFCNNNQAPTVTLDLSKIDSNLAAQILAAQKKIQPEMDFSGTLSDLKNTDPKALANWAKSIGDVIKEVCNSLNVSVNEFIKTPAGIGVAGLIIWKVGGPYVVDNMKDIFIGIPVWILCSIIILTSLRLCCFPKKVKKITGEGKTKVVEYEYKFRNEWSNGDRQGALAFHCFIFAFQTAIFIGMAIA